MNSQILWDCHMHSSFSADSDASMEAMADQAVRCGLEGICLTEHLDLDFPNTPEGLDFSLDVPAYERELLRVRELYADRLTIRFGLEFGLQPHLKEALHRLLDEFSFDFVIGSSHAVHGYDPYYPGFYQGRGEQACYMEYFESVLENLVRLDEMDVYGHLDYVVRYGPSRNREYSYDRYRDILDEILRTLVEKHIGLELNTGGFHYGLGEPNPCASVIRRYRELGGEIITVGADAHSPRYVAYAFDKAAEVLKSCGFEYYTVFKNRSPEFIKL